MGIVGMLIFIPIVSVVYTLFKASVYKHLRKKRRDISDGKKIEDGEDESGKEQGRQAAETIENR